MRKVIYTLALILLASFPSLAQSRTMYIGDVELRIGMSRDATMKLLAGKYKVMAMGATSFTVSQYNQRTQLDDGLGVVGFENNELTYISRDLDTSGWPHDEGFAITRAIYDAISNSISITDSDGAKRSNNARITIGSRDVARPRGGNIRTIDMYVNERRIMLVIWDGNDGVKSVNASIAIRKKPW